MTTENQLHTPGPWSVSTEYPHIVKRDYTEIGSSEGELICSAAGHSNSGFFPSESEAQANARLIAAAPELLEALELARECLGGSTDKTLLPRTCKAIDTAIAKATGAKP